jgi:DTW domain-containing protein YfiP
MSFPAAFEPRTVCSRCRRPESVCYCRHVTSLETKTRIVLLQHPRERDVPIGTAHMASLCLPNAELHVGVHWRGSAALSRALSDPTRPAALLYPGAGAIDVVANPPSSPVTLVVVDGTWPQTKKVVKENPELAALPRYAFTPSTPSEYRIRKEPRETCVSTIEALVHVLGALEGDPERFRALLAPFRAMVEAQIACATALHHGRARRKRAPKRSGPRVPLVLSSRRDDLVCIGAEANAWPYSSPERETAFPDELIQWVAYRPRTGESFEFVLAPRNPLSPNTARHIDLSEDRILGGGSASAFLQQWLAFVRDTDVFCSWGDYAPALFAETGGGFLPTQIDLRRVARNLGKGKIGTAEEFAALIGAAPCPSTAPGRAGVRLAQLAGITKHLSEIAREGVE